MSSVTPPDSSLRAELAHVKVQSSAESVPMSSRVQQDLRGFFSGAAEEEQSLDQLLKITSDHLASSFVGFYQVSDNKIAPVAAFGSAPQGNIVAMEDFISVCTGAAKEQKLATKLVNPQHKLHVVAVPSIGNEPVPTVLAAIVTPGKSGLTTHAATMERMSAAVMQWRMNSAMATLDWEAATSAAITELISGVQVSESMRESSYTLVNALRDFTGCEQVAVSFVKKVGVGCELQAISEMAEFDKSSETSEHLAAAMEECLIRDRLTVWPPLDSSERHATICHRKLTEQVNEDAAVSIPLVSVDDQTIGVLTVIGNEKEIHSERIQNVMRASAPHLGTALALRQKAEPGRMTRLKRWVVGDAGNSRRKWLIAAGIIAALLIPCVPWRHRVKSDCVVEPVVRRFSVAPFDGKLKASAVRPGDIVTAGQVLASMDDRELQLELIDTMAEKARESTKRDQAMDVHNTSEARLAELEMERLDSKYKLLKNRENELEITSQVAGVVLRGDLDDAIGAPVKVGETLFEIAPLNPIKLELAIPEMELPSVEVGMTVHAQLDGYRGEQISGQVTKIHPRAEIRESKNVFIAEVEFENPDNALRPGMGGVARVRSTIRPLGWIWFHKAWHRIRTFTGV